MKLARNIFWWFLLFFLLAGGARAETREGWVLNQDQTIVGDLELATGVLDLNGFKLSIEGRLIQSGGQVRANKGLLQVGRDYRIEAPCTTTPAGFCASNGILEMNGAGKVLVNGNFIVNSREISKLTAGVLEIKGNFVQLINDAENSRYSFAATGMHLTLLSGSQPQTVFMASPGQDTSHFAHLSLKNNSVAGVGFLSPVVATQAFMANSVPFTLSNPAQSSLPGLIANTGPQLTLSGPIFVGSGQKVQLAAAVISAGGTPLQVQPNWSVEPANVVSIDSSGIMTVGTVSAETRILVTARIDYKGSVLTVTRQMTIQSSQPSSATLTSLTITGPTRIQTGGRLNLMAQALYSDGATRTIAPVWKSANPSAAAIGSQGVIYAGPVTAETPVMVTATYSENGVTATAQLEITVLPSRASLSELSITGPEKIQSGGRAQLFAHATYSDDSRRPLIPRQWSISNPALASIDERGFLKVSNVQVDTPLAITATATEGGTTVSATYTITITQLRADLGKLTIVGARGSLVAGEKLQLIAEGRYADGSRRTVKPTWQVSDSSVASIDADGLLTTLAVARDTPLRITALLQDGALSARGEFHTLLRPSSTAPQPQKLRAEVEATGEVGSYSLSLWINTNPEVVTTRSPRSTTYNLYVVALLPAGQLATVATYYMLDRSSNWQTLSWPLAEYLSGIEENSWELIELIESFDASLISGTQIFVGYGTSSEEMLQTARYQLAYQIP